MITGAIDIQRLTGGAFAILILYVFLRNLSMTILIAACIPHTGRRCFRYVFDGRIFNILSLMGLMIAVETVDNAIVVVEAIYARRIQGQDT